MNVVILMGRLARSPEMRWAQNQGGVTVARFTLAVDRRTSQEGQQSADFISCVAFGKTAEFCGNYLGKGSKVALEGRIQTGSYTNRDGQKIYTTDVVAERLEFAESKAASERNQMQAEQRGNSGYRAAGRRNPDVDPDGFMNIPDGIDEQLPFT